MFLHGALLRRADYGRFVFLREIRRELNVQIDLAHEARHPIGMHALYDLDAVRWDTALLTEAQHVDARARPDRREESRERCGR